MVRAARRSALIGRASSCERVLRLPSGRVVDRALDGGAPDRGVALATPGGLTAADRSAARSQVRHMLRLDEDYAGFYAAAAAHPASAWIPERRRGAAAPLADGVRGPRQADLHDELHVVADRDHGGQPRGRARRAGGERRGARASPRPRRWRARSARFYEKEVRSGYRAGALAKLAEQVASGALDVEAWLDPSLSTADLTRAILSVRGAGPYTAENLLKLLGRYEGMAIDSWCRAKYLRLYGGAVRRPRRDDAAKNAATKPREEDEEVRERRTRGRIGARAPTRGKTATRKEGPAASA
jgi:3-methyladenine DNA glycosylase/8-oxoguanine DNA glycosylase